MENPELDNLRIENERLRKELAEVKSKLDDYVDRAVYIYQRSVANGEYEEFGPLKVFESLGLASQEVGSNLRVVEIHAESAPNRWEHKFDEVSMSHIMEYRTGYCGYVCYRIIRTYVRNRYNR
jgi:peptide deformylase